MVFRAGHISLCCMPPIQAKVNVRFQDRTIIYQNVSFARRAEV
jgi:hypothetical protein